MKFNNKNASLVKVDTEARREAAEIEANTNLEVQTMLAEAQLEKTRNEAKAEQLLAKAEGTIAPWISWSSRHLNMYRHHNNIKT